MVPTVGAWDLPWFWGRFRSMWKGQQRHTVMVKLSWWALCPLDTRVHRSVNYKLGLVVSQLEAALLPWKPLRVMFMSNCSCFLGAERGNIFRTKLNPALKTPLSPLIFINSKSDAPLPQSLLQAARRMISLWPSTNQPCFSLQEITPLAYKPTKALKKVISSI